MPWTPLHAALGEAGTDLNFKLIERACAEGVVERDNLDWKRDLPLSADKSNTSAKQHQQLELAKDIAGMANTGGGMIVYGVDEKRLQGTSAADKIIPVGEVDEDTLRNIRRVAGNLIYPPVTGLDLIALTPRDGPADGVLALIVPDSFDGPHLVHPSNGTDWFGAPYRHGPDTEWMVERQLASAYADRESGRRRRAAELEQRFVEFTSSVPQPRDLRWVIAIAVPERPHPRPRELDLFKANEIIERAWKAQLCADFGPRELTQGEVTRRGLQRFTRSGRRIIQQAGEATARARVEVHGDGAVAVAFTRDGAFPGEGRQHTQVAVSDIESTALDFLALLTTAHANIGTTGDYGFRLAVFPPTEIFRVPDSTLRGTFLPWNEERVHGYRAVDGSLIASSSRTELVSSWFDVVTDAINQAGANCSLTIERIHKLVEGLAT